MAVTSTWGGGITFQYTGGAKGMLCKTVKGILVLANQPHKMLMMLVTQYINNFNRVTRNCGNMEQDITKNSCLIKT